jgi:TRAP-type C4-dicarboxylate transport system permease small subunit
MNPTPAPDPTSSPRAAAWLDRGWLAAALLVVPLCLLLFAQWPLRDLLGEGARLSNDLGQICFALYVAVAVTAATRRRSHLAAHLHPGDVASPARWRIWATALCVLPWALFMLWAFAPQLADSVLRLERFGETLNPGYFVIKLALLLMLLLIVFDAVVSSWQAWRAGGARGRR